MLNPAPLRFTRSAAMKFYDPFYECKSIPVPSLAGQLVKNQNAFMIFRAIPSVVTHKKI
jgi:hypothetical protein